MLVKNRFRLLARLAGNGNKDAIKEYCNLRKARMLKETLLQLTREEMEEEVEFYQDLAKDDNYFAHSILGRIYYQSEEWEKAVEHLKIASDNGIISAMNNLGYMYRKGKGVEVDDEKAIQYLTPAADQGDRNAQVNLYNTYTKLENEEMMMKYLILAADQGKRSLQFNLGLFYHRGKHGLKVDYEKAVHYYTLAAEQGLKEAMSKLGIMYKYGLGVEVDFEKAREYFLASCD